MPIFQFAYPTCWLYRNLDTHTRTHTHTLSLIIGCTRPAQFESTNHVHFVVIVIVCCTRLSTDRYHREKQNKKKKTKQNGE